MKDTETLFCKVRRTGTGNWYIVRGGKRILHRDHGPAVTSQDGCNPWYRNGRFYRDDGLSMEGLNAYAEWHWRGGATPLSITMAKWFAAHYKQFLELFDRIGDGTSLAFRLSLLSIYQSVRLSISSKIQMTSRCSCFCKIIEVNNAEQR